MRTDNDTWDITTSVGSTALFAEIYCRAVGGQWADLLDNAAPEHALSAPGSHLAVEEAVPMDANDFIARHQEEERGDSSARAGPFFQLVYNEQYEPAAQWFGARGWRSDMTPLPDYLRAYGRPTPSPDSDAGAMTSTISLVSAIEE